MHYKQIIDFFLQFDTNQLWGINILNFEVLLAYLLVWFSDMIPLSFRFKSYTLVGQCLVDLMKQFLASLSSWGSCVFLSSSSELGGPMTLFFGRRRNLKIMITKENTKTIFTYLDYWFNVCQFFYENECTTFCMLCILNTTLLWWRCFIFWMFLGLDTCVSVSVVY